MKTTLTQGLPPDPVEAERSTVRLLQALSSVGRLSTTVGYRTIVGACSETTDPVLAVELLETARLCAKDFRLLEHGRPLIHFARITPLIKVTISPTSTLLSTPGVKAKDTDLSDVQELCVRYDM